MQNKIIGAAIFAASALLFISTAYASVGVAAAPSPCDISGTPFLTITENISNDADSGNHGDWATDAFTENVSVWVGTDGQTYCANANTINGTFVTTGPLSPEAGVALSAGITGTFTGGENYTFPATLALNPSYSTTTVQAIVIPASTTDGFSAWVSQVFPIVTPGTGSGYVNTYSLTYLTVSNGNWTDADGVSGGDQNDITGAPVPCTTAGIGSPLLINVTQQISNDPDSGNFGGDWALDNFIRHIQVWAEGSHYCAQADDSGTFTTFGGATGKSPQSGAALPEVVTGTMLGSTHGEISGATAIGDAASWGTTGTTSVAEDCGGTDCSMTAAWVSNYFGSDTYDYGNGWSWTYNGGANGTWTNASAASTGDILHIVPPTVTTEPATGITSSDATMNGFNGDGAADTHSFWVSTSTFSTVTTNIPDGVYSTPGIGAVAADSNFSDTLSSVTVDGVTTGGAPVHLPAITPGTTYYYVAWAYVGGNWNPGAELSFTTAKADQTITFAALSAMDFGAADFDVSATASSNLDVSFAASGAACTLAGTTVHITNVGTCTITASQAGDTTYNAAADVQQSFTVSDVTAPVISGTPSDIIMEATSPAGATVNYSTPTSPTASDDVDGTDAVSCTPASGSVFALGTTPVTCNATDAAGNAAIPTTFNVTIRDTTAPVITLSGANPMTVAEGSTFNEPGATASDLVDGTDVVTASGTLNTSIDGTYTIHYNASDAAHNAATEVTRTVHVTDQSAPVIAHMADISASATSASGAVVAYFAPATSDNVDGAGIAQCLPLSGTHFAIGTDVVTCTATDAAGNQATPTTFNIIVKDSAAPVISGTPATTTAEASSALGAIVTFTKPTATDAIDGAKTVSCSPASGSQFALGTTTVTCSATDNANNTATASFKVIVKDTNAPTITLNGSATIALTVGATYTELGATATDTVDGTDPVTIAGQAVDPTTIGTYTVTYDSVDAAGNHAAQVTRTVTVAAAPVIPVTPPASGGGGGGGGGNGPIAGGGGGFSGPVVALPNNGSTATSTTGTGTTGGQVLGASVYAFLHDFGVGAQGTDVTQLQSILKSGGFFSGPVIGSFGPLTKAGVIKFQIANHVNATGYVGPLTRIVLNKGTTPTMLQELESQLTILMAKLAALKAATSTSASATSTIQ